jgi:hypothetical protein
MSNNSILDGCVFEDDFARDHNLNRRTVWRYRKEQDGLPYVMFGGKVWIPIEEAKQWLHRRIRRNVGSD